MDDTAGLWEGRRHSEGRESSQPAVLGPPKAAKTRGRLDSAQGWSSPSPCHPVFSLLSCSRKRCRDVWLRRELPSKEGACVHGGSAQLLCAPGSGAHWWPSLRAC